MICRHGLVGLIVFVGFPILIVPGLPAAQADDAPKIPQGTTLPRYQPITKSQRTDWFVKSTVGPKSLAAGVWSTAWGTALNHPPEYGPHISGFAQRYGMRLPEVVMGNAIEAGLGAVWQEDPRYDRSGHGPVWQRFRHAATMTVLAYRGKGSAAPAYARYAGIVGENFVAKAWRADSESSANFVLGQCALGFVGRFAGNLFDEFWSDVRHKVRYR
jgi:hypothetical protein